MKSFLRSRTPLKLFFRLGSKTSRSSKDKQTIERLDHESTLLFGEPLKNQRRKSRKNVKLCAEEDNPDECIYYEISSNEEISSDGSPNAEESVVQPFNDINQSVTILRLEESIENNLNKTSLNEPVPLFPLLNEMKKEYVPRQIYYINPMRRKIHQTYPTVTNILNETMSEKAKTLLNRWKENKIAELGKDGFEEQQKKQLQFRNIFLKLIQKRLLGVQELDILPEYQGCWQSLECVFPLFTKVRAMEKMVVHPELHYKGMIDSILEFKSKPVLVSWKKSSKLKSSIDMTFDAPVQISAYIGALNYDESYPFKIEESLLVMSYDDGSKADIFHLKKENCLYYWKFWLQRLHMYKKLKSEEQPLEKSKEPESFNLSTESKGFNAPAYTTFTEVKRPSKRTEKSNELIVSFPLYNDLKKDYISGQLYEIKVEKQAIHSGYPSVTTILGETRSESSKFVLRRWKDNLIAQIGEEGFEKYQKNLLATGTLLHRLIQQRLLGTSEKDLDIVPELVGCWKSLDAVFPLFTDVKVTESCVVHDKLKYKGVIDCIAEFRGKPILIDWKKSDKIKASIDMTYDAPLQIAAYIGATNYDDFYPFKIEEGLLVMSYIDGTKADIFYLNKENCQHYWNLWLQRLYKYQKLIKTNDLKLQY